MRAEMGCPVGWLVGRGGHPAEYMVLSLGQVVPSGEKQILPNGFMGCVTWL